MRKTECCLKIVCLIFSLVIAGCQDENPFAEFDDKIQKKEHIETKKYNDGTVGYVLYKHNSDPEETSRYKYQKWLLNFNENLYFQDFGRTKDGKIKISSSIGPNKLLAFIFDIEKMKPLTTSRINLLELQKDNESEESVSNIASVQITAARESYLGNDYLRSTQNALPNRIISVNCIKDKEIIPSVFSLSNRYKNSESVCFSLLRQKYIYFLESKNDEFYGRISCANIDTEIDAEAENCQINVVFDFNRTALIVINKQHFKKINSLVKEVYNFLKSSTLVVDETIFRKKLQ